MEHLFTVWPQVLDQIENAAHILFLSDFDGTLAPIVEKPELAEMCPDTRQLLRSISQQTRFEVGIISGRALSDLKEKVHLDDIIYAGNHGFEIEGPGLSFVNPISEEIKPLFRVLRQVLTLTLGSIKGVRVEDKGITLSVHYRQVDESRAAEVETKLRQTFSGLLTGGLFSVTPGKKVFDIKPAANWDKGKAIRLLMKRFGQGGRNSGLLPLYLGDDITDEDGFRAIEKYGSGITIHIGENPAVSLARYFLRSPEEVSVFLARLLDSIQRGIVCEQYSTP